MLPFLPPLNISPGVEGENMRYCSSSEWDISGTFYNELEDDLERRIVKVPNREDRGS